MRRRVLFTVDIYAADGAAATEVQRHLTYLLGAPVGVDLVDTQRHGDDHLAPPPPTVDPVTGEVTESDTASQGAIQ